MSRKIAFVLFCSVLGTSLACTSATAPNGNAAAGNTAATNHKLPEGLSTSPVPITGTTPGIPDANSVNMNAVPKGATPTPGIPDPATMNKPFKPGATPTPGIPDPKTIQKQLNSPANMSQSDSTTRPANGNTTNKPPTVRKP